MQGSIVEEVMWDQSLPFFIIFAIIIFVICTIILIRTILRIRQTPYKYTDPDHKYKRYHIRKSIFQLLNKGMIYWTMKSFGWQAVGQTVRERSNSTQKGEVNRYQQTYHYFRRHKHYRRGIALRILEPIARLARFIRPRAFKVTIVGFVVFVFVMEYIPAAEPAATIISGGAAITFILSLIINIFANIAGGIICGVNKKSQPVSDEDGSRAANSLREMAKEDARKSRAELERSIAGASYNRKVYINEQLDILEESRRGFERGVPGAGENYIRALNNIQEIANRENLDELYNDIQNEIDYVYSQLDED